MVKRNLVVAAGMVAMGISLIALPAHTTQAQSSQDNSVSSLNREIAELKARLAAAEAEQEPVGPVIAELPEVAPDVEVERQFIDIQEPEGPVLPPKAPSPRGFVMSLDGDAGSWLGVETQEVSSEKAKSLKLSSERGALIGKVLPDSPANKAGLKENDVVTEINGQRVEGTAQFRRMIREIPGGRAVQLSVWRDGKQQTITATLGKSEERRNAMVKVSPQGYSFRMPEMNMPEVPEFHNFFLNNGMLISGKPRLGIDAEDLTGQLGNFFGVPEGEGILVRNVNSDSPAEKAGLKAGDVITSFNSERIRTAGELREKLASVEGGKSITLGLVRNKSEVKVTVELPAPVSKEKRKVALRTNI